MANGEDVIYRINDRDEIIFVNEAWDRFAAANGGEAVMSTRVLHRPLWDFIADVTTCELYRQVLKRARDGRFLRFTFRCDSPLLRRLLEMNVRRCQDGSIEFRTHTLFEESRQPTILLQTHEHDPDTSLRMCSWCKKVLVGGSWLEVEDAVVRLQLFHHPRPPLVSHGICEQCSREMARVLASP